MGARPFHGSDKPKKCLALELRKARNALWPQNVFGGGTSELLQAGEEIECAWRSGKEMLATTPQEDDWTGAYTWRQDNERVSIWFDIPEDVTSYTSLLSSCTFFNQFLKSKFLKKKSLNIEII